VRRQARERGFAATGDLLVKLLVFAVVFLVVAKVLLWLGVNGWLACAGALAIAVLAAAKSGMR
jgi:hypothetical protein